MIHQMLLTVCTTAAVLDMTACYTKGFAMQVFIVFNYNWLGHRLKKVPQCNITCLQHKDL